MSENAFLSVLICDDQPGMRMILEKMVAQQEGCHVCATVSDGDACIEAFLRYRPQVVFLDVEMPGKNGLECAQSIMDIDPHTVVIFATAHTNFMDRAFELYAFDYLVKPFKAQRVAETLARIRMFAERQTQVLPLPETKPKRVGRLLLKANDALCLVDTEDIILIQRENRATVVYTAHEAYQSSDTLTALEEKLDMQQFFRCHKSYIINLSYVDTITPYGRWTYIVTLKGLRQDALITHDKFDELKDLFS